MAAQNGNWKDVTLGRNIDSFLIFFLFHENYSGAEKGGEEGFKQNDVEKLSPSGCEGPIGRVWKPV